MAPRSHLALPSPFFFFRSRLQPLPLPPFHPAPEHPFPSPQAGGQAGRERGPRNQIKEPGLTFEPWSCHGMATFSTPMPPFWKKHRIKIWGPAGEDGWRGWGQCGESGCGVGWGDNPGLSARQNFQPWSCWAFPRGHPPWARQQRTWTDPGH